MSIEFVTEPSVEYVHHSGDDKTVVNSARVSTMRDLIEHDDEKDKRLIRRLMRDGHMSTFEHCTLTVRADVPIFVAREWMRHRTQSFNEVSGRYSVLEPRFYIPGEYRPLVQVGKAMDYRREPGTDEQRERLIEEQKFMFEYTWNHYQSALEAGIAREVARNVLPVSLMTQFYATANLRNWFHFLHLRTAPEALYEIQQAAAQVEDIIRKAFPEAWDAWHEITWNTETTAGNW